MSKETDRGLNKEQVSSIFAIFKYLKENHQVLDPVTWKTWTVKVNYFLAGVPVVFAALVAFNVNIPVTQEQVIDLLGFLAALAPLFHNIILACTSKNVTLNPVKNNEIIAERELQRSLNNPLLNDVDSDE